MSKNDIKQATMEAAEITFRIIVEAKNGASVVRDVKTMETRLCEGIAEGLGLSGFYRVRLERVRTDGVVVVNEIED